MKKLRIAIVLFMLSMLWVPPVLASTVTYSGSYNGPTDVTDLAIYVSQFDPSLGTLVSATFDLDATMTTQYSATNDGDFYAAWDKMTYLFSLTGAPGYSDVTIDSSMPATRILGSGTPDGDFGFVSEYLHVTGAQSPWYYVGPTLTQTDSFAKSALSDFTGTGTLSFDLTTLNYDAFAVAGQQTNGQPSSLLELSTNILGNVSVTYDFTPVPIPGAVWLLASGLVGVAGLRKKFQN